MPLIIKDNGGTPQIGPGQSEWCVSCGNVSWVLWLDERLNVIIWTYTISESNCVRSQAAPNKGLLFWHESHHLKACLCWRAGVNSQIKGAKCVKGNDTKRRRERMVSPLKTGRLRSRIWEKGVERKKGKKTCWVMDRENGWGNAICAKSCDCSPSLLMPPHLFYLLPSFLLHCSGTAFPFSPPTFPSLSLFRSVSLFSHFFLSVSCNKRLTERFWRLNEQHQPPCEGREEGDSAEKKRLRKAHRNDDG